MDAKISAKAEFISILNNLKTLYSFDFIDDETFDAFLKQIAENLLSSTEELSEPEEVQTQDIGRELRKAKDRAIEKSLLHFGSFN